MVSSNKVVSAFGCEAVRGVYVAHKYFQGNL